MTDVEIGIGKTGRQAYGFENISIVPSRRTRDRADSTRLTSFCFSLSRKLALSRARSSCNCQYWTTACETVMAAVNTTNNPKTRDWRARTIRACVFLTPSSAALLSPIHPSVRRGRGQVKGASFSTETLVRSAVREEEREHTSDQRQ